MNERVVFCIYYVSTDNICMCKCKLYCDVQREGLMIEYLYVLRDWSGEVLITKAYVMYNEEPG
jgi:hypothetical protein